MVLAAAGEARAQSPFQPSLTDPRNAQRFGAAAPLSQSSMITPPPSAANTLPPSGAGETGFDSTGTAGKKKKKTRPGDPHPLPPPPPPSPGPPQAMDGHGLAQQAKQRSAYADLYKPPDSVARRPLPPDVDPYDPLGVRVGTFVLKPSIEAIRGYDTNPSHIPGGKSSGFTALAPELHAKSDWERHELDVDLRGSFSEYDNVSSLDTPFVDGKSLLRLDVTRNSKINIESRVLVSSDYPGSPNLPVDFSKLPTYIAFGNSLGFTQTFNRLEITAKGTFDRTSWWDTQLVGGGTSSNHDRDYSQYGGVGRASYELFPGVKPFVELAGDMRQHDLQFDRDGYQRDSTALTPKVGTSFEISKKLTGEISVGYLDRHYVDPRLQDLRGVVFDGTLKYQPTGLTTVTLTGTSRGDEVVVPGWSGALRRDVGVQVDHALRRWLIWTVRAGYGFDSYIGSDRDDQRVSIGTALTYKFNRQLSLRGEYRYDQLRSNVPGVDYNANVFLMGLKWQR